ncbi:MAG: cation-translocating P-type ATPase [Eubacteriales bacterium]|nr:cation-translocating P-type ATPase [Eubacteriales bacterium]MDD3866033.1 cation-translocating P-type ATPase [Eubacteriales bacterium]MDD4461732.1 cation-translocating P-type ATPase [Eubacteriales bacterium]
MNEAYLRDPDVLLRELAADRQNGLKADQVRQRQEQYGPNTLQEKKRQSLLIRFLLQFKDVMVLILLTAALVSGLLGEYLDAAVILAIIMINALLGLIQEGRAEKAIEALQKMASPQARVIRDGQQRIIEAAELVPGDIVLIEAGDVVPADLRLLESYSLRIEESSLTGESVPVEKEAEAAFSQTVPLGDRLNMLFMSTAVTYGRGVGLAVTTGAATEIGKIAGQLQSMKDEATPLQKSLNQLGRLLGLICVAVCLVVFAQGMIQGGDWLEMFMTAVSLAVAAIPEGLPAVVTIVLALGMKRMADQNAIVKKLLAVETLGSVDRICSDKTGTLTQNEMTVTSLVTADRQFEVTGQGYDPAGQVVDTKGQPAEVDEDLRLMLTIGVLCNDAELNHSESTDTWQILGDPTEAALLVAAAKAGLWRQDLQKQYPREGDRPFDSERKMMTTFHRGFDGNQTRALTKGAPDIVLARCRRMWTREGIRPMSEQERTRFAELNQQLAAQALRVLAYAFKPMESPTEGEIERDMILVGLTGMIDPARPEAREAIHLCRQAGIRARMITGDYEATAVAIARDLDLMDDDEQSLSGSDLDRMSDAELNEAVEKTAVYARVSPEHKVRIVQALRERGHITSMTGDGVNDALALKSADIGVAMGITGTDVAKGTADMILTDDNFATIVQAVREGRIIYSNIRKFVAFLLSCNVGEILVIALITLFFGPANVPLLPIQLLWLNLVTDSFPALALGREPGEPNIMKQKPRHPDEPILNRPMLGVIASQSLAIFVSVLAAFLIGRGTFDRVIDPSALALARTYAFATLILAELLRSFCARSERISVFRLGLLANRHLNQAVALSGLLLLAVVYVPFLSKLFSTVPLRLTDWLVIVPLALIPFTVAEVGKLIAGLWGKRRS